MKLKEYIDQLPKTVWGLVALMSSKKIKGIRGSGRYCPLALFISKELGTNVAVGWTFTCAVNEIDAPVFTTSAMLNFIKIFDRRKLPAFEAHDDISVSS